MLFFAYIGDFLAFPLDKSLPKAYIIRVGSLPLLVKDSTPHEYYFYGTDEFDQNGTPESFAVEGLSGVLFLCPIGKARWGKAGREMPATVQRVDSEELPFGGAVRNAARMKVKAGDSIPARDMTIGLRGKTPVWYARP